MKQNFPNGTLEIPERGASLTHEHLLAIIATELKQVGAHGIVRLLDMGCGDARLLAYLHRNLPRLLPGVVFELYGIDVHDHGVQAEGFLPRAIAALREACPGPDWAGHIHSVGSTDPWPVADDSLDVVVTNQVLEHVRDHAFFFAELHRTLKDGGISVNLFPLRHCVHEGHLRLPFVHRFRHADLRRAYIQLLSRFGLGKYPSHHRKYGLSLGQYTQMHADYIEFMTNYLTWREVLALAKRAQLRGSFRYTQEFYFRKLRDLAHLPPRFVYRRNRNALADWAWAYALKYASSITLFLEKRQTYGVPDCH